MGDMFLFRLLVELGGKRGTTQKTRSRGNDPARLKIFSNLRLVERKHGRFKNVPDCRSEM